jgi:uncharacterized membrane protein YkvA (DUF1232 family)
MGRALFILKFLFDKNIPLKEKWWVIIPLIYILSPADLIPAPVLGFGIVDDLIMLSFLLTKVYDKINKYYFDSKKTDKKNIKDIIENVEYEIKKDGEE